MITPEIERLVPGFILKDANGYALAKAIETGMQVLCEAIQGGIDTILDPDKMPEWRLDEMAWEMGGLYDYNATIEEKRVWIKEAVPLYASYGTAIAIEKYLKGYFDEAEVEEGAQYGADPFHFRITVRGDLTDAKMRIAQAAAKTLKNVRSVLDDVSIGNVAGIAIHAETDAMTAQYAMAGNNLLCGIWPGQTLY